MKIDIYIDTRDWWVGYYRGDTHHYVCPLPCVVIRWRRDLPPRPNRPNPDVPIQHLPRHIRG